ncbi:MAG: META domain-containing protein [Gemmatimonadota bacterium]
MRYPNAALVLTSMVAISLCACQKQKDQTSAADSTPPATAVPARRIINPVAPPLVATEWKLRGLAGKPAGMGAGNKPATLLLESDSSVSGFAGCNRFRGIYSLNGDSVKFGPLMSTKMACPQGTGLETAYLAALATVRSYTIAGDTLSLGTPQGPVASFLGR